MFSNIKSLNSLKKEIEWCNSCTLMGGRAQGAIWDDGNPMADVVIVAEAPGETEEALCLPLIGPSGALIEQMLNAIDLSRKDTWRCNVCACHPYKNADPTDEQVAACNYYLKKQIEIIQPKVLILLGKFAAQTILKTKEPISKIVNKFYEFEGQNFTAYTMYHPSYVLRGSCSKEKYLEGFKEVSNYLKSIKGK